MHILTYCHMDQASILACAQAGCQEGMAHLLEEHVGLVQACIHYLEIGGVPYGEAVEEGRIGLWRAILRNLANYFASRLNVLNYHAIIILTIFPLCRE